MMMLAMMVAALGITACGGDDNDIEGDATIVGVWECVSSDFGEWGEYAKNEMRAGDILYMYSDNTYMTVGHNNERGTWSLNDNELFVKEDAKYSIGVSYTITQLTNTTLKVELKSLGFKVSFRRIDNNEAASIVGVWECTQTYYSDDSADTDDAMKVGYKVRFNSDGSYTIKNESGRWAAKGNTLYFIDEYGPDTEYTIEKLTSNELVVSTDFDGYLFVRFSFKRIS